MEYKIRMKRQINSRIDLGYLIGTYQYPNIFIKPINMQFASRYGEVNSHNIDRLLYSLKVRHNDNTKKFCVSDVYELMTQKPDTVGAAITKLNQYNRQTEDDLNYIPNFDTNSVDKWYRPRQIQVSTNQFDRLFEGAEFSIYQRPTKKGRPKKGEENKNFVDLSINQDKTDAKNSVGKLSVDTRVFGTKDEILNGKINGENSLEQSMSLIKDKLTAYKRTLSYINNGNNSNSDSIFKGLNLDKTTISVINKWLTKTIVEKGKTYVCNRIIQNINRLEMDNDVYLNKYNTLTTKYDTDMSDKVPRYNILNVNGTNVKCIALFAFKDFCFHSALKHNTVPVSKLKDVYGETSPITLDAEKKQGQFPVSYDKGKMILPTDDISNLFGLESNLGTTDHPKLTYKYQGKNDTSFTLPTDYLNGNVAKSKNYYSTITQFMDKSILYANYALKQENFKPDFILSCPSSSKFNLYYCTNLSRKLNVPYINDFFEKDMVEIRLSSRNDNTLKECMEKDGFNTSDIINLENQVKNMALRELGNLTSKPILMFINQYWKYLSNIKVITNDKIDILTQKSVWRYLSRYFFMNLKSMLGEKDELTVYLLGNFSVDYGQNDKKCVTAILNQIYASKLNGELQECAKLMQTEMKKYCTLIENGYIPKFISNSKTKITEVDKRYRPYLSGLYVVKNKYISQEENQLLTSLRGNGNGAKFLIFDEDINSGASLRLTVDALKRFLGKNLSNNVMCLCNAYSNIFKFL